jgi:type I restriction enzyme R subunit
MQSFSDYYYGYTDAEGNRKPGYIDLVEELKVKFPLEEPQIIGEQNQKEFISLFGAILRLRNILSSFDEFDSVELFTERDLQDYLGRYQDLRDEWKRRREGGEKADILDDVVFEIELIKQIEINIDYILILVKKYHDSHCEDKEVLVTIKKAIDASPELRSKKALIENFMAGINDVDDVMDAWHEYVAQQKEEELKKIIEEEHLKEKETRQFVDYSFRVGGMKTTGTDIDVLMPPMTRFGSGNRAEKKNNLINRLLAYFERFFGVGVIDTENEEDV